MKVYKKIISLMLIAFILINISIPIVAHQEMLLIEYDDCSGPTYDETGNLVTDGEDETWYWLEWSNSEYHISHTTQTIKYYFADYGKYDSSYTWTTDTTESEANDIKEAFANSMKKWNDIYYYSYDSNGNRTAHKVINVVEGSENDHNLIIHPAQSTTFAAQVCYNDETTNILETNHNNIYHYHPENWYIEVDVDSFVSSKSSASMFRERTGQHELGHILGIYDVDVCCNATVSAYHHEEILMGYGNGDRSTYAKYKDIAGVSITRGFHTDSDHIWILRRNIDGTNDVICALCNGVRYNITLTLDNDNNPCYESRQLNMYKSCVHHGGTNEEMLLVATDGIRNFFKCLYCRHIEEVDISTYHSAEKYRGFVYTETLSGWKGKYHKIVIYDRENYTFKSSENDDLLIGLYDENLNNTGEISNDIFAENGCTVELMPGTYYLKILNNDSTSITSSISVLPPPHIHSYTEWAPYSPTQHIECCDCGAIGTLKGNHVVRSSDSSKCMLCGALIDLVGGFGESFIQNVQKVTLNGSYILPNGIIVLVDEDIEAYFNGTLVFYDKNNLPQTQ